MRKVIASFALIAAVSGPGIARAQDGVCDALFKAYEHGSKLQSRYAALTVTGALTPARADALSVSALLVRQLNLTLMIENKCPIPTEPVSLDEYRGNAAQCALAIENHIGTNPSACSMDEWKKGN